MNCIEALLLLADKANANGDGSKSVLPYPRLSGEDVDDGKRGDDGGGGGGDMKDDESRVLGIIGV